MDVKRTGYNPQFQARIFLTDSRINKFVRQSDRFAREQTIAAEAAIENLDKTTMVIMNIIEKDGKHFMAARNPKTRVQEFIEISNPNHVENQDRFAYLELVSRVGNTTLNNIKSFWGIK